MPPTEIFAKIRQYNMKRTLGEKDGPQRFFESDNKDALV